MKLEMNAVVVSEMKIMELRFGKVENGKAASVTALRQSIFGCSDTARDDGNDCDNGSDCDDDDGDITTARNVRA